MGACVMDEEPSPLSPRRIGDREPYEEGCIIPRWDKLGFLNGEPEIYIHYANYLR